MTQFNRGGVLIIGCDYSVFHSYLRTNIQSPDFHVQGFVYCKPGDPPFPLFKGFTKIPIKVHPLEKLEEVIQNSRIRKCQFQAQNISMTEANSIINRIVAAGCTLELISPKDHLIKCFKPTCVLSSLAPAVVKTQIAHYFSSILSQHNKRIVVIFPILDLPKITDPVSRSQGFSIDDGIHYEFKPGQLIPKNVFSDDDTSLLQEYQECGAFRLFATSNVRRAIICAEQHADVIIVDSRQCELSLVKSDQRFCIITQESIENVRETSLWPGLINLNSADHVILVSPESVPESYFAFVQKIIGRKTLHLALNKYPLCNPSQSHLLAELSNPDGFIDEDINDNSSSDSQLPPNDEAQTHNYDDIDSLLTPESSASIFDDGIHTLASLPVIQSKQTPSSVPPAGKNSTDYVTASQQRDIDGLPHQVPISYQKQHIVDVNNTLQDLLSQFYSIEAKPQLQEHFAAQADIIMAMAEASRRELKVGNNDSANREAFCRLFLSSHIPPGFRVTTGEIIDASSNTTGQLDVVVVNDSCPRLTIDSTNSIIAPILADTVLCVIEVKTTLTEDQLTKALGQMRPVKALMPAHSTLVQPNGTIVEDPLEGKIITGIFSFNQGDEIEGKIDNILTLYPGVADFIVLPGSFGYFSVETLKVCGFQLPTIESQVINGYVKFSSKGMALAILFGIINSFAAIRRFSGSNCIRYLHGSWGKYDGFSQWNKTINVIDKYVLPLANKEAKQTYFKAKNNLTNAVSNFANQNTNSASHKKRQKKDGG